ncbi:hypothetical protein [Zymobacter sp. IVIA_5232.4 C2]|uniref:hypothetical protein n=1 Tax=Zymobacter sp. IVIA_5232.4 C2 TaxID=3394855 RepID=UPI0039C3C692
MALDISNLITLSLFSIPAGISVISMLCMPLFLPSVGAWVWLGISSILAGRLTITRCRPHAFYSALIPFGTVAGIIIGFFSPAHGIGQCGYRLL